MGISAQTPTLFRGLYNIIHNESDMDFFLANGPEEKMIIIEQAAPVDSYTILSYFVYELKFMS